MFYSHEILTSPEHGVATIWLVATLGSKSITKKLNKKAILDVDVPKACDVITNPEAPMALRLQGSLLYGVSRVFSQQCAYTLTDVQTMHDKMRTMLKALPGGGLDPAAGKARPEQLILPDDPSFIPEINLPGLGIDLSKLTLAPEVGESQQSLLWTNSPDLSQTLGQSFNLQLDLSSDDLMRDLGGIASESEISGSVQRKAPMGRISTSALDDEAGVLLQPDFEFDEDGNIIELAQERRSTNVQGQAGARHMSETPLPGGMRDNDLSWDYQPMMGDDEGADARPNNTTTPNMHSSRPQLPSDNAPENEENNHDIQEVTTYQARRARAPRVVPVDDQTALRNTELAQINNEYVQNMLVVLKQKEQNKLPALAKKNAAFWVFGQGIGSVGVGLGASHVLHPLCAFSGNELHALLSPETKRKARKRGRRAGDHDDGSGSDSDGRRVRARGESEEQIGRGANGQAMHDDVEIGRHASPAFRDDHSSQMPWNITASIQSSRHGSSAANFSSRGMSDTASVQLAGFGRPRSRLTSASPLAGRGFPFDLDALNGFPDPGMEGDNDVFGDFDLSHYLQTEADGDGNVALRDDDDVRSNAQVKSMRNTKVAGDTQPRYTQDDLLQSSLDQESINFLEFMHAQTIDNLPQQHGPEEPQEEKETPGFSTPPRQIPETSKEISFSGLLPPKETTRTVATHALMHILALATKGFITVHQDEYEDLSSEEYGIFYRFGEISVCL